jgi:hypothetical protein
MRCWLGVCVLAVSCFTEGGTPKIAGIDDSGSTSVGASSVSDVGPTDPATTTSSASSGATLDASTSNPTDTVGSDPTMVMCGDDEVEIPPIPRGWQGPAAVLALDDTVEGECPDETIATGFLVGAPDTCSCTCTGAPDELCSITVSGDQACNDLFVAVQDVCQPVLGPMLQYSAQAGSCVSQPSINPPLRGAVSGLACTLPAAAGPCVMLPPGFEGPCIFGGADKCPDDWPEERSITQSECGGCDPSCDTTDYCSTVVASPYSDSNCAVSIGAVLEPVPTCNSRPSTSSVGFVGDDAVSCPSVDALFSSTRLCCV